MSKLFGKLLSVSLASVMCISLSMAAFAAESELTGNSA